MIGAPRLQSPYCSAIALFSALVGPIPPARAEGGAEREGRILVACVAGRPGTRVFSGHPGWVDAYAAGRGEGISARIGEDGAFRLPPAPGGRSLYLIVQFDRFETPPFVVAVPAASGSSAPLEIVIPTEYACVPGGYPEVWEREYKARAVNYHQTFVAKCTALHGITVFDGPKIAAWGNKLNASVHEEMPGGPALRMRFQREPLIDSQSAGHSDRGSPRIGWRYGDARVRPGSTYAIRVGGYRPHGGKQFELDAYVRPDRGEGYSEGEAFGDGKALGGDLCCLVFGNGHGQNVETHIRSEEWEIFLPRHRPATSWGQTFLSHGTSLAGVCFWAACEDGDGAGAVRCEVRLRPDGPWEPAFGPRKVAAAHPSPERPTIRYPEIPGRLPGKERLYELPAYLFQVAYAPDELPLVPGKTYFIDITASRPILVYADGDFYHDGHAYYEGLRADRTGQPWTFHSERWTLAMGVVTYARPGGEPTAPAPEPVKVLLDTDVCWDAGDVAALAFLHGLAALGEAEIIGITCVTSFPYAAGCVDAIDAYYGRPGIPVGALKDAGFLDGSPYAEEIAKRWPNRYASGAEGVPDATAVFRRALAAEPDGSVVVASIGPLRNLRKFLESPPDDASPLPGRDLIEKKVKKLACMAGVFAPVEGNLAREWNVEQDIAAAKEVFARWPTPIVFSGYEIGAPILADRGIVAKRPESPVARALGTQGGGRPAWDQTAILYAVRGCAEYWRLEGPGRSEIRDDGSSAWTPDPGGRHYLLRRKMDPDRLAAVIDAVQVAAEEARAAERAQSRAR